MKNKIGWCDMTFNPVWGCLNHCEYCYARKIAKRFANKMAICEFFRPGDGDEASKKINNLSNRLKEFIPTFLYGQYYKKLPEKSQKIFIGSMSEISHWDQKWIVDVIHKIKQYPQHIFQFLTRYPDIYLKYVFPKNCWLGMTITKEEDIDKNWGYFFNENNRCFFSIEPFLDRINPESLECIDWVIIGAETGNRKEKVTPKKEWIERIVNYCKCYKIPIYLKDSLKDIYPVEIKEFPKIKL